MVQQGGADGRGRLRVMQSCWLNGGTGTKEGLKESARLGYPMEACACAAYPTF